MIVKVGGSLFDMPDLALRLQAWLVKREQRVILVPGGGAMADLVRAWDQTHGVGEEKAHWLALQAMSLSAAFLAGLLPGGRVFRTLDACGGPFDAEPVPIADMYELCRESEQRGDALPHSWDVTSDSLALWLAQRVKSTRLVLLKSMTIPAEMTWEEAARRGFVDSFFPKLVKHFPAVQIEAVNFRLEA